VETETTESAGPIGDFFGQRVRVKKAARPDLPGHLPVYRGTRVEAFRTLFPSGIVWWVLTERTEDTPSAVQLWYLDALPKAGWTVTTASPTAEQIRKWPDRPKGPQLAAERDGVLCRVSMDSFAQDRLSRLTILCVQPGPPGSEKDPFLLDFKRSQSATGLR
jgi:hypothetical protein